ncbi:hypothetical protein EV188_108236 [Actinomycetospora succinea]|uniref:Uncharacterized protein n=1 Tax=Actinomycetospora succinea TaxID=663603 RepID=A0A4R6V1I7_9PSEU|nr:hypothetical protein [Actinomycetospora succinea]TDQ51875.1 hypothetical protein EV188_108236 [Actinomycetospora succinea]
MSTEDRYRRLLGLLPAWYRERYGDEMVDVYLAGHREQDARPGAGEVAATARLAVTTRLRAAGRPSRATLWLVALVAASLMAARASSTLWSMVDSYLSTPATWSLGADGHLVETSASFAGGSPFEFGLYDLLWVAVLVLLLVGVRRAALVVALPVAVLDVSAGLGPLVGRDARSLPLDATLTDARAVVLPMVVIAALVLARSAAGALPRVRERVVAAGLTVGAVGATAYGPFLLLTEDTTLRPWSFWAMLALVLPVAGVVVLLMSRWLDPAWPAALLTLAVVALVAGPLPAGQVTTLRFVESIALGMSCAAAAAVLAAVAWFLSAGRYVPEHVGETPLRREIAA